MSPTDDELLRLEAVRRRFSRDVVALDGVTFSVRRGRITALIGASGSGKTTLLRLIAGLDQPTSGSIRFVGPSPRMGFVFQQPALMPWARVHDNVALPMQLMHAPAAISAEEALAQVDLADKAGAMPHQLSGGQQMRVSIARALASAPDLLLLDEPFAALDEINRQRLCDLVVQLAQSLGLTMIFVTHNISEAVYVADDVIVLTAHPGRVAQQVAIEAQVPRSAAFRAAPAYARQCADLSAILAGTMA